MLVISIIDLTPVLSQMLANSHHDALNPSRFTSVISSSELSPHLFLWLSKFKYSLVEIFKK